MIYTLGHTEAYERYFQEQGVPQKLGKTDDYVGGSVWQSFSEANKHRLKLKMNDFSVYGVLADWNSDTEKSLDGDFHDLLVTSDLIKL